MRQKLINTLIAGETFNADQVIDFHDIEGRIVSRGFINPAHVMRVESRLLKTHDRGGRKCSSFAVRVELSNKDIIIVGIIDNDRRVALAGALASAAKELAEAASLLESRGFLTEEDAPAGVTFDAGDDRAEVRQAIEKVGRQVEATLKNLEERGTEYIAEHVAQRFAQALHTSRPYDVQW